MASILYYPTGSTVTVYFQGLDDLGARTDGYAAPMVDRLILPDLTVSSLYPLVMNRLYTGLYYHKFNLPSGSIAIGSYLVDISWRITNIQTKSDTVQVVCLASAGMFSVSPT